MAPFTHVNVLGSRFSDGSYGVYYAARQLETAIRETAYHFARFASHADDPPRRETMRVLVGSIEHSFDDVYALDETTKAAILDKHSYAQSRPFGTDRLGATVAVMASFIPASATAAVSVSRYSGLTWSASRFKNAI